MNECIPEVAVPAADESQGNQVHCQMNECTTEETAQSAARVLPAAKKKNNNSARCQAGGERAVAGRSSDSSSECQSSSPMVDLDVWTAPMDELLAAWHKVQELRHSGLGP